MSFEFQPISYANKSNFYKELRSEIKAMLETTWFTNLSNASSAIMAHMPDLNWAGFYLLNKNELILGPFQGLPACLRIPVGKGVCGTAALKRESVLVDDVRAFPGHIACDARSRSELVVPLVKDDRVLGVLDLDSPRVARFHQEDLLALELIAKDIVEASRWPTEFV